MRDAIMQRSVPNNSYAPFQIVVTLTFSLSNNWFWKNDSQEDHNEQ